MKFTIMFLSILFSINAWGFYLGLPYDMVVNGNASLDLNNIVVQEDFGADNFYNWREIEVTFCPNNDEASVYLSEKREERVVTILPTQMEPSTYHAGCYNYIFLEGQMENADYRWILNFSGNGRTVRLALDLELVERESAAAESIPSNSTTDENSGVVDNDDDHLPPVFMEPEDDEGRNRCNPDAVCDDWDDGSDDYSEGSGGGYIGAYPIF